MAKVRLISGRTVTTSASGSFRLTGIAGNVDLRPDTTTSNDRQIIHRTAGTFSESFVSLTANTCTGASSVDFQVNTSDGNQTMSISAGSTGEFEDLVNSDTISAGDKLQWEVNVGSGGNLTFGTFAVSFEAGDGSNTCRIAQGFDLFHSADNFNHWCGSSANNTSGESLVQARANFTGTWKNFSLRIGANSHTTTTTYRNRIGAANGSMSIAVSSSSTGDFEDLVNTDAVSPSDLIDISMDDGGGTGTIVPNYYATDAEITDNNIPFMADHDTGTTINDGDNLLMSLGGRAVGNGQASRANFNVDGEAHFLGANVSANSLGDDLDFVFRIGAGTDTALTFTVSSGSTGQFNDLVNSVSVASTDDGCYRIQAVSSSGSATLRNVRMAIDITEEEEEGANSGTVALLIV